MVNIIDNINPKIGITLVSRKYSLCDGNSSIQKTSIHYYLNVNDAKNIEILQNNVREIQNVSNVLGNTQDCRNQKVQHCEGEHPANYRLHHCKGFVELKKQQT